MVAMVRKTYYCIGKKAHSPLVTLWTAFFFCAAFPFSNSMEERNRFYRSDERLKSNLLPHSKEVDLYEKRLYKAACDGLRARIRMKSKPSDDFYREYWKKFRKAKTTDARIGIVLDLVSHGGMLPDQEKYLDQAFNRNEDDLAAVLISLGASWEKYESNYFCESRYAEEVIPLLSTFCKACKEDDLEKVQQMVHDLRTNYNIIPVNINSGTMDFPLLGFLMHTKFIYQSVPKSFRFLIQQGALLIFEQEISPVHYCLSKGDAELMTHYLNNGWDVDSCNKEGKTLLHRALCNKWGNEMINMLVGRSANVNAKDIHGKTPLWYAVKSGLSSQVIDDLVKAGAKTTFCDEHGEFLSFWVNPDYLPFLIKAGFDVNQKRVCTGTEQDGDTPLHYAVKNEASIEGLLAAGACVNAQNEVGQTALHYACKIRCGYFNGDKKIMLILQLLKAGIDLEIRDTSGKKAVDYIEPEKYEFEEMRAIFSSVKNLLYETNDPKCIIEHLYKNTKKAEYFIRLSFEDDDWID